MRKITLIFLLFPCLLFSQNKPEYATILIPPELLENANAVIRKQHIQFDVEAPGKAVYKEHRVVTLFNDNSNYDYLIVHYNPYNKLGRLNGKIYDAMGNLVRKIGKKEIRDESAISSSSIYDDNRVKYIDINYSDYPFTVEFEYEMAYNDLFVYPSWGVSEFKVAVQHAELKISIPSDLQLYHKTLNVNGLSVEESSGDPQQFTWSIENIKAVKKELYCPISSELLPRILVSPSLFEAENYTGSMSSWNDFGLFMNKLMLGKDDLSPEMQAIVSQLTANVETDREKIDTLYRYLQKNMRYVSVQLGIGGWQPFDTKYVESNKYGDCKALSNFMKALLKEAGIPAYPVLIKSGKQSYEITDDFTYPAFNHMILYVPSEKYWLECTSNTSPPNYLSSSCADRNVLLVTENGGELARTPAPPPIDNQEDNEVEIQLEQDGKAVVKVTSVRSGNRQEWYRSAEEYYSDEDLKKEMMEIISLPSFTLDKLSVTPDPGEPKAIISYTASVPRYASKAGKRLFVPINAINSYSNVPPENKSRTHPIEIKSGYTEKDKITLNLPDGFHIESMPPENNVIESEYGHYSLDITNDKNKLTIVRHLEILPVRLPAEKHADWRNFHKQIAKLDGAMLVLVNKT